MVKFCIPEDAAFAVGLVWSSSFVVDTVVVGRVSSSVSGSHRGTD